MGFGGKKMKKSNSYGLLWLDPDVKSWSKFDQKCVKWYTNNSLSQSHTQIQTLRPQKCNDRLCITFITFVLLVFIRAFSSSNFYVMSTYLYLYILQRFTKKKK